MPEGITRVGVVRRSAAPDEIADDLVTVEEPLEIQLRFRSGEEQRRKTISITMRTPGEDFDLAAGFLYTEGIVREAADIVDIVHCGPAGTEGSRNVVRVDLQETARVDLARLERHFYTTSSCGVCGKTSLEALEASRPPAIAAGPIVSAAVLHSLPAKLREAQPLFESTGGLHASALFTPQGELIASREDVGRHNALDKLIGSMLRLNRLPLSDAILLVSGRASFELLQKALMGGIPVVAAVGAPSSLAIDLARKHGMTLIGFLRADRFNVYCGAERIRGGDRGL
jgi:FdhD protein